MYRTREQRTSHQCWVFSTVWCMSTNGCSNNKFSNHVANIIEPDNFTNKISNLSTNLSTKYESYSYSYCFPDNIVPNYQSVESTNRFPNYINPVSIANIVSDTYPRLSWGN